MDLPSKLTFLHCFSLCQLSTGGREKDVRYWFRPPISLGIKLYNEGIKKIRFPKVLHPLKEKYRRYCSISQDSSKLILIQ